MASSESDTKTIGKSGTSFAAPFVSGGIAGLVEAVARSVGYTAVSGLPGGIAGQAVVTPQTVMDYWLQRVCAKPEGYDSKDDTYGYGMPLGSLLAKALAPTIEPITAIITPIITLAFLGMVISSISKAR
ncbi:hypothetical protein ES703_118162 [subsurface metagenome]